MQTMTRWTDDQMDTLEKKVDGLDTRVGQLNVKVDGLDRRVGQLEVKVDALDQRIGRVEIALVELNREVHAEFRSIRGEIKMLQATTIGGFVTVLTAMVGLFATQL